MTYAPDERRPPVEPPMTTEALKPDTVEPEGREWFWRIVDAEGLGDVPSDEEAALKLLVARAKAAEASQDEASAKHNVRSQDLPSPAPPFQKAEGES